MTTFDKDHPVWQILKAVVLLGFVALFAWTNASSFDSTEITMLAQIAAVLFGTVFLERIISKT